MSERRKARQPTSRRPRSIRRPLVWLAAWLVAGLATVAAAHAMDSMDASALPAPQGEVVLIVEGAISRANTPTGAHLDLAMIQALPARVVHTATSVTDGVRKFEGPLMRDLLKLVGARGVTARAEALNDYSVDIPIADFRDHDVIVATHMDGKKLTRTDKGPLWIVYPRDGKRLLQDIRYDYRWVWQLNRITIK